MTFPIGFLKFLEIHTSKIGLLLVVMCDCYRNENFVLN